MDTLGERDMSGISTEKEDPARKPGTARQRALEILARLERAYPEARISLQFADPYQLLVAVVLSAQCSDAMVNRVTPPLFRRFPTPHDLARASPSDVEPYIRSLGLWRTKARYLTSLARVLVREHGGRVPSSMEALLALPGVARKTANVVLGTAFGVVEGIAVDTHVARLSRRLGLTASRKPREIEKDLMSLFPREAWYRLTFLFIEHGRAVCRNPRPRCSSCTLAELCPSRVGIRTGPGLDPGGAESPFSPLGRG